MMSGGGSCRYPFTAIQWQELEHQALVFKYMASGMPVPPDLLFTIRRSLDSSFSSSFLMQQPQHTIGWNGFQVGFGRKIDPEPGRCRRTDGKKWRCSKEAYPDSKYCERHMHRGRNRSRKPVEILSTPPKSATTPPNAIPINSTIPQKAHSFSTTPNLSSRRSSIGLQENPTSFLMDSAAYSHIHGKDYRSSNGHGLKREISEHTFFAEANPISNDDSTWQLAPLTIGSSLSQMKHKPYASDFQTGRHLQSLKDYNFDDMADSHHPKKIMHHFLDESPNKDNKDTWLISDDKMSIHNKTHLSNSVPKSMHDFFMTQN